MDNSRIMPDRATRSPWSILDGKQAARVDPSRQPVEGTIRLSGSKSLTNRALILAALAIGTSRIEGVLRSDDAYWCIACLTGLGVRIELEGDCAVVEGCGGNWPHASGSCMPARRVRLRDSCRGRWRLARASGR